MLDRRLVHIQADLRDDLGRWIGRKRLAVARKRKTAETALETSGHAPDFLRAQWADQRTAQLSVRSRGSVLPAESPADVGAPY